MGGIGREELMMGKEANVNQERDRDKERKTGRQGERCLLEPT